MAVAVDYAPRFLTVTYLERDRLNELRLGVYRDGAIVAPTQSGSTVSLYDAAGTAVVSARAVTVASSYATVQITAGDLSGKTLGARWRIEWSLVMADTLTHVFHNEAALCRTRLPPQVSQADIYVRHSDLANHLGAAASWQSQIDAAHVEISNWLEGLQRRPYLICSPYAVRILEEYAALSIIARSLGGGGDEESRWERMATHYDELLRQAKADFKPEYDSDDDGTADARKVAEPPIFLTSSSGRRTSALWR